MLPALLVVAALGIAPTSAAAAEEVPPGNSAVNQYTEAFPTSGGDKDAHERDRGKRTPKNVLGERNAEKLNEQGPDGDAVAELTAETAPDDVSSGDGDDEVSSGAIGGNAGGGGGGATGGAGGDGDGSEPAGSDGAGASVTVPEPDGSSGISEVIARATGTSDSGGLGIFLPLLIVATLIWAFAYIARQRRPAG